jgi:hypothetical protein
MNPILRSRTVIISHAYPGTRDNIVSIFRDEELSQARNQHERCNKQRAILLLGLLFSPEDEGNTFLRNVLFTFTGLHCVTCYKAEIFCFVVCN